MLGAFFLRRVHRLSSTYPLASFSPCTACQTPSNTLAKQPNKLWKLKAEILMGRQADDVLKTRWRCPTCCMIFLSWKIQLNDRRVAMGLPFLAPFGRSDWTGIIRNQGMRNPNSVEDVYVRTSSEEVIKLQSRPKLFFVAYRCRYQCHETHLELRWGPWSLLFVVVACDLWSLIFRFCQFCWCGIPAGVFSGRGRRIDQRFPISDPHDCRRV